MLCGNHMQCGIACCAESYTCVGFVSSAVCIQHVTSVWKASAAVLLFEGQMATVTLQTVVSELLLGLQNYTEQAPPSRILPSDPTPGSRL
jgi:hypothetical protein